MGALSGFSEPIPSWLGSINPNKKNEISTYTKVAMIRVHIMLLGRFSEGDLISPATAAILVTPAKDRNTNAEALPRPTAPFQENKPSSEKASL